MHDRVVFRSELQDQPRSLTGIKGNKLPTFDLVFILLTWVIYSLSMRCEVESRAASSSQASRLKAIEWVRCWVVLSSEADKAGERQQQRSGVRRPTPTDLLHLHPSPPPPTFCHD